MALATSERKSDGVVRYFEQTRSGTRTAVDFDIDLGFYPERVVVTNVTDRISAEWTAGLNALNATGHIKTWAAGTRTYEDCGVSVTGRTLMVDISVATLETDNDITLVQAWG